LPHLKRGCIRDFKNVLLDGGQLGVVENKTESTFTFPNESIVEFFPADDASKMRGSRRDILFINECNNVTYEAFQQLDVRTRKYTILDFNPTTRFWVHDELLPMLKSEEFVNRISTYNDAKDAEGNWLIEQAIIDAIERRKYNPRTGEITQWYRVYGIGEIGSLEGLIFDNWAIVNDEMPGAMRGYGVDFGFVNSATAIVQVNECNGELYVDELFYEKGASNEKIFSFAKENIDLKAQTIADCNEPKTIDYLYKLGWFGIKPAIKGADSVQHGINILQSVKINITKRSVNLIKEMREYEWDTDKAGKRLNEPIKINDHAIDAMRYLYAYPKKKKFVIG
jgi:phage terminase large subunit